MSRFLNYSEEVTYGKLRAVTDEVGAHVFSKVRLADVIPVNGSGISSAQFSFALKAHVDFLVTDSQQRPQFCVEFDGPSHRTKEQTRRDEIKNALFTRFGMPFMRINANYLENKYRGLDLLTYFVDVWFLSIAFDDAQAAGLVPWDEPFDPQSIFSDGTPGARRWPYWLSLELQVKIQRLYERNRVVQMCPSRWIGADPRGNYRCIAWIFVTDDSCVVIETGMRRHLFPAVYCPDVLSQLAVFDLYDALDPALCVPEKLKTASELDERLMYYKSNYEFCSSASCGVR